MRHGKNHYFNRPSAGIGPTPMWWVHCFMTKKRRKIETAMLRRVVHGIVDADNAAFPLGNRRPHIYYW
jgi:hypothetical protein